MTSKSNPTELAAKVLKVAEEQISSMAINDRSLFEELLRKAQRKLVVNGAYGAPEVINAASALIEGFMMAAKDTWLPLNTRTDVRSAMKVLEIVVERLFSGMTKADTDRMIAEINAVK